MGGMNQDRAAWLRAVAREQRALLLCVLAYLLLAVAAGALATHRAPVAISPRVFSIVATIVLGACAIFGVRLAGRVFGTAGGVLYALLLLGPLLATWVTRPTVLSAVLALAALVALLVINGRATRVLRDAGVRVGLIGADPRDLR